MISFIRSSTALIASLSLALAPLGAAAQTTPEPNAEQMDALRALIAASQGSSEIAEQLRQLNGSVAALRAQVEADADKVDGLESAIATMARTLISVEEVAQQTEDLLSTAQTTADALVDEKFAGLLDGVGDSIKNAADIANLPVDEALKRMEEARASAEALREEFLQQGRDLQERLNAVCTEAIPADTSAALAGILGAAIPQKWTANLAATAKQNGIDLPDCFSTPGADGQTAEQEVLDYLTKRQASQEMANAMNSMMMMAMSTGNPYIIAAAVVIMALMAIFGDSGGGGEGEGNESNTGETSGTDTGTGEEANPQDAQPAPPNPDTASIAPPTDTQTTPPGPQGYPNVEQGVETIVEVSDQIITLTDIKTKTEWVFDWPDFFSPLELAIPDFSNGVRIMAADAVAKTITVRLHVAGCSEDTNVTQTFKLKADSKNSTVPVLAGDRVETCINDN